MSKNLSVIKIFLSVLTDNWQCKINPYGITRYYLLPLSMNNFDNIPSSFAVCYLANCPRKDKCLRYQALQGVLSKKTIVYTVLPSALHDVGTCVHYRESIPVIMAYGFKGLFANVKKADVAPLRVEVMNSLGSHGSYYRYNKGEKYLIPSQQEAVLNIFRKYGYTSNLQFDGYVNSYDFSDEYPC